LGGGGGGGFWDAPQVWVWVGGAKGLNTKEQNDTVADGTTTV